MIGLSEMTTNPLRPGGKGVAARMALLRVYNLRNNLVMAETGGVKQCHITYASVALTMILLVCGGCGRPA